LSPEYGRDRYGDPQIMFQMSGLFCRMNFFDCKQGRCGSIQLETALDLANGTTAQVMNEYNKTYRYGRMYLDEEMDPYLQFDFELPISHVEEYITSQLDTFELLLEHLPEAVEYYCPARPVPAPATVRQARGGRGLTGPVRPRPGAAGR